MNSAVGIMAIILLALLFFKIPVFVAVLGASVVYFILTPGINPAVFAQQAITGSESVTLLAIPFFVCAGVLMNYTGVTKRIMDFCAVLTGRMYGGLSQVNILLSTLMGGLSGSALVRLFECRRCDAVQDAGSGDGIQRDWQSIFHGSNCGFQYDHTVNPAGNWTDSLWLYCECINR